MNWVVALVIGIIVGTIAGFIFEKNRKDKALNGTLYVSDEGVYASFEKSPSEISEEYVVLKVKRVPRK